MCWKEVGITFIDVASQAKGWLGSLITIVALHPHPEKETVFNSVTWKSPSFMIIYELVMFWKSLIVTTQPVWDECAWAVPWSGHGCRRLHRMAWMNLMNAFFLVVALSSFWINIVTDLRVIVRQSLSIITTISWYHRIGIGSIILCHSSKITTHLVPGAQVAQL